MMFRLNIAGRTAGNCLAGKARLMLYRIRPQFVVLFAGWLLLAGCSRDAGTPAVAPGKSDASSEPVAVEIALNWYPEAEHGGFYAALLNGEYEKEGLKVTIRPGGPQAPALQQVATGQVQFCVDNADKLLLARAQQADVVAVMVPIHDSPRCILVHESSGIQTFEDLAKRDGLKLAINTGQPFAQYLQSKLDLSKAQIVPYPGNVVQFVLDENYAQQAYSFSEPFAAGEKGIKSRSLMVSDLGFNTYTSCLVTSQQLLKSDPELVRKVVRASLRGWQQYLQDPGATNAHIHEQNLEMGLGILEFGVEGLKPLCRDPKGGLAEFGRMDPRRWTELVLQMEAAGSLKASVVAPMDAWSNEFLPAE
jgi:NitT/TauT family transport system substrate-binding protein